MWSLMFAAGLPPSTEYLFQAPVSGSPPPMAGFRYQFSPDGVAPATLMRGPPLTEIKPMPSPIE